MDVKFINKEQLVKRWAEFYGEKFNEEYLTFFHSLTV